MARTLSYNAIRSEYEADNRKINDIYNDVIVSTPQMYSSFFEYETVVRFLVEEFVGYNDYLHSNNLIQMFKSHAYQNNVPFTDWVKYYSVKIYTKRTIKHYLNNPFKFWEIVYELADYKKTKEDYTDRLDSLLIDTLEFYKREYVKNPNLLRDSLRKFVGYYKKNKKYSEMVTAHIIEMSDLLSEQDVQSAQIRYNSLESKYVSASSENSYRETARERRIHENYYSDITLDPEDDRKKKIVIVGCDPFVNNTNVIYGIAKKYGLQKDQLEIYSDYEKLKMEARRIVEKTQWNKDKYIGIIFGSIPHSVSGKEDASSLVSLCESTQGFPLVKACRENNTTGALKITKANFINALKEIIIAYKSQ